MIVSVDQNLCIKCGACAAVCPSEILGMTPAGPEEVRRGCIVCGHCVAVCPTAALDLDKVPLKDQKTILEGLKINEEQAEQFLRSRRSIRTYKKEPVPREKIQKILEIARVAPTGSNSQGTRYLVIETPELLDKLREQMLAYFEEWLKSDDPKAKGYRKLIDAQKAGKDVYFRGAPQLILALNEEARPDRYDNGQFALTYAELFAPSIGVGTCWAGFFLWYYSVRADEARKLLGIPEGWKATAALMVGIPRYTYKRMPERHSLEVEWR